jgi:sugar lactone lactonase YvrE
MDKVIQYEAAPLLDRRFILGEGPVYDKRSDTIMWVDIRTGALLLWDCKTKQLRELQTGQNLGAAVPAQSGKYLAAMTTGIYYLDEKGLSLICRPPELKDNLRINDAKCDPAGRLWFGTLGLFKNAPEGSLFRLDPDGTCRRMLAGVKLSNGLAWSVDKKTMYYIDTPQKGVDAFDFEMETGNISNRRRVISFPDNFPDGMTIDSEDQLWVALWGSGKVVRCDPAAGSISGEVPVPARNTSSCCFAGENLDTLIITSSGEGLEGPGEGCVFYAKPGVKGTPVNLFRD